jgi:hypothetical protein
VAAGLVCLAAVAALATGARLRRVTGRAAAAAVGLVSGAMNVVAGISGPPVVLFALNAEWPPERVRPTMQLFFLGLNALTLLSLGRPDRLPAGLMVGFVAGLAGGPAGGLRRRPGRRRPPGRPAVGHGRPGGDPGHRRRRERPGRRPGPDRLKDETIRRSG